MTPAPNRPRQLIVCCDGTWNIPENESPTHIGRIAKLAAIDANKGAQKRLVFYVRGVGGRYALDRLIGGAVGQGLHANIKDAYLFLASNYRSGDQIFIFGFSRGAFTARCLAGMIDSVGLLKAEHTNRLGRAYRQYRRVLRVDEPELERRMTTHPRIQFLGVFDTVGALGVPILGLEETYKFRTNILPENVLHARHALAVHERRMNFTPTVWQLDDGRPHATLGRSGEPHQHSENPRLVQMWFSGVHSDIGGGYLPSDKPGLGSSGFFTLKWMLDEAKKFGFEPDESARRKLLNELRPKPMPRRDEAPAKYEVHDSMRAFYWLTNLRRRFMGALKSGDSLARRRIVDSGAACQAVHESVWLAYVADEKPKHIGAESIDEPLNEFVIRHRTALFPRGHRVVRIARRKDLRTIAERAAREDSDLPGASLNERLMAVTDARAHRGSWFLRLLALAATFAVLALAWKAAADYGMHHGVPDLTPSWDQLSATPVLIAIAVLTFAAAVLYGLYLLYLNRFP